jgi:hypothetical protein
VEADDAGAHGDVRPLEDAQEILFIKGRRANLKAKGLSGITAAFAAMTKAEKITWGKSAICVSVL